MDINIPIYVESLPAQAGKKAEYIVRPLFFLDFSARSQFLQKAINELIKSVREHLVYLGKELLHHQLAEWTYCPEMKSRVCELHIDAGKVTGKLKLLVVTLREFERRIAFSPSFPDLWVELGESDVLEERFAAAIGESLRKARRDPENGEEVELQEVTLKGPAWLSEIDLRINPPRVRDLKKQSFFALLGSEETLDGEHELHRVGRCLNYLYPDDLDRVLLRDREVQELNRLLKGDDKRPVLIVGRRQVGKTALVHEYVFQHVRALSNPHRDKQAVWLLSPQRLISGMQYVGQWESRLHAILKHAAQRDLVLYFDDVIGLFQAGQTSQSSLSVAAVLKSSMERRAVRVLPEITPEAFRVLCEKDRAFADMFHVIPVDELHGDDNLRVQIDLLRSLEFRHQCRFTLDALPTVIDLQRRYARDIAFPGKAARFLKRLAVKAEGAEQQRAKESKSETSELVTINREAVLDAFHEQSGLPRSFLDQQRTLPVDEIRSNLHSRFVGQPQAVQAAIEILSIAKARLNDPTRPLASLLLLGPTGVGKTEFAKSLAAYLFGNADRLLRFDMNEYVSPLSVPQLVGTFAQPEGLLTAAVRRQPFAVVLFDEIEKGHPDVFDLLLQVLGEGRLTDALGRTTDFSNTIVVLTSNLGTRRSEVGLGFGTETTQDTHSPVRAAEEFFRPEFFNRLDRVIPFGRLSRDDMQQIARHLMSDVLQRDGLVRRQCVLTVSNSALDVIVQQGYDPTLGARALKRAIERELTRPIARFLAANGGRTQLATEAAATNDVATNDAAINGLMLISVDLEGVETEQSASLSARQTLRLKTAVRQLAPYEFNANSVGRFEVVEITETHRCCRAVLARLLKMLPGLRSAAPVSAGALTPQQSRYFLLQEELHELSELLDELEAAAKIKNKASSGGIARAPTTREIVPQSLRHKGPSHGSIAREIAAGDEIDDFLSAREEQPIRAIDLPVETRDVVRRLGWLDRLAHADESRLDEQRRVLITGIDRVHATDARDISQRLAAAWSEEIGLEAVCRLGFHPDSSTTVCLPMGNDSNSSTAIIELRGLIADEFAHAEAGFIAIKQHGNEAPRLVSVQVEGHVQVDRVVRTVLVEKDGLSAALPSAESLRAFAFDALPLPDEFTLKPTFAPNQNVS